jgi:hypothetical protein
MTDKMKADRREQRKKLALQLVVVSEEILSKLHPGATLRVRKQLKASAKDIAKKFLREMKSAQPKAKAAAKAPEKAKKKAVAAKPRRKS